MNDIAVTLSEDTHRQAEKIAEQLNLSVPQVLVQAVDELRRRLFFDQAGAQHAALRNDPVAWQEELDERAVWDVTLADGLDEPYLE